MHTLSLFGPSRADFTVMGAEGSILLAGDTFQLLSAPRKRGAGGVRRATGAVEEEIEVEAPPRKQRGAADPAVLAVYADFVECVKSGKRRDAGAARGSAASRACWLAELSAGRRAEVRWEDEGATPA